MSRRDSHLDNAASFYEEAIVHLNRALGSIEDARLEADKAGLSDSHVPAAYRHMNALRAARATMTAALRAINNEPRDD